ncbi:MAG: N-acetylmuramoyl-L-alanine amidase [Bryobacteraceae bacterium]|jgi:N-acetylmuramoyl-L-alanine amidase
MWFSKKTRTLSIIPMLCVGILAFSCALGYAQDSVTAVRFWSLGDVTRIAIEATGPFTFKSDRLANPDRIFFDLPGTHPVLGHKGMSVIAVSDQLLRQIRVAETQRGTTRVVLDVETAVEVDTSKLENPDRLIIELRRPGSQAPHVIEPSVVQPSLARPSLVQPSLVPPAAPIKTFRPPVLNTSVQTADRRIEPVLLDAPAGIVAGQRVNASLKMPVPAVPPPPVLQTPAATPIRTARATPAPEPSLPVTQMPDRIGLPAKRPNDTRDETMIRALGLKVGRIVIDAGHGGHDAGSIGPGGMLEKDLVLDVAKRLGALVEQRLGCEVVYTRTDDTFIPLEQRTEIANDKHADLFLSIHANSSSLKTAAGVETYYLNFTTSKSALDVAARENATSQKTIFELQDLLQKIALKDKVDESREFAARIQSSLYSMSARSPAPTRDRGIRKAPFIVLIGASMPSVLAEIGFISNPRDEAMMKRADYRQKIAEALYKGVGGYAATLSHFQVAQIK